MGNQEDGRVPAEPGSREPDPQAVPALSGFDPSRMALGEAVYVIRNIAGMSARAKARIDRPFDFDDFVVWAEHWCDMNRAVIDPIAARHDQQFNSMQHECRCGDCLECDARLRALDCASDSDGSP